MSYEKGTFAFFDGTELRLQEGAEADGLIAGYKVTKIAPNAVKLDRRNQ